MPYDAYEEGFEEGANELRKCNVRRIHAEKKVAELTAENEKLRQQLEFVRQAMREIRAFIEEEKGE